jgi:hypothetical protein
VIKKKCHDIRRKIEVEINTQPYDHVHAICGADFFDDLITRSEIEKARRLVPRSCAHARAGTTRPGTAKRMKTRAGHIVPPRSVSAAGVQPHGAAPAPNR